MSLAKYKKSELKEILDKLKLSTEGLKQEMEDRIDAYLQDKKQTLDDLPELKDFFNENVSSPVKRARKSVANTVSDEADKVTEAVKPYVDAVADLDVSPSKVAKWANDTRDKVVAQSKASLQSAPGVKELPSTIDELRAGLSKVSSVAIVAASVEAVLLAKHLLPLSTEVKLFGFGALSIPDLLVVLALDSFWKPLLAWALFQIIPLILGSLFNLRSAAAHVHGSSSTAARSGRRASSPAASSNSNSLQTSSYVVDPVTFAAAKLLLVQIIFESGIGKQLLGRKQIALLELAVGEKVIFTSAAVTLLFALYEAILL
ncbi:hypothetical protein PYCC9005_002386 [Savitreella phatthalungensis]